MTDLGAREQSEQLVILRRVWELRDEQWRQNDVASVQEEPLALDINGQRIAVLMRLPGADKELAVGFALSEGIVKNFDQVLVLVHDCGQDPESPMAATGDADIFSRNRVELRVAPDGLVPDARLDMVRLIRAGCGNAGIAFTELLLDPVTSDLRLQATRTLQLARVLRNEELLHNAVGGVHDAALFDAEGNLLWLAEDVGRHNAVDKVLGYCLINRIPLDDRVLLCTGRLSYEMVTKAIRMRIPVLVSISAPTALAIDLAHHFGVTLIAYLRGSRMTVYTHPERIIMPDSAAGR
ncbi:MAG: formate dehydrogenase accessory sulfurtransferase FdhD [Anaerolineae bacterium]